jgi:hypothetical protein
MVFLGLDHVQQRNRTAGGAADAGGREIQGGFDLGAVVDDHEIFAFVPGRIDQSFAFCRHS